jgi:hypothetical protein
MTRVISENMPLWDPIIEKGYKNRVMNLIPANGFAIPADSPPLLLLNPAGAVNILMPASTLARAGLRFTIVNLSGSTITIQTDGGAAFASAIAIATTQMAELVCTGNTTANLGWRALVAAGTQTSP